VTRSDEFAPLVPMAEDGLTAMLTRTHSDDAISIVETGLPRVDARVVADQLFDSACAVVSVDNPTPMHDTSSRRTPEPAVLKREQADLAPSSTWPTSPQANSTRIVGNLDHAAARINSSSGRGSPCRCRESACKSIEHVA